MNDLDRVERGGGQGGGGWGGEGGGSKIQMQQHRQQYLPITIVHTSFALKGAVESANIVQAGALEGAL